MSLQPGARLSAYEVLGLIGTGGMGEVYRARDTKLHRDIALKVLPDLFARDPERLARFEREAQVLASLNHPNIAAIYGVEESRGIHALVLEFVNGPTLADRIAHGPIPLPEALPIARQIAEALEAAHEHGIIHRDLKPANIKLRPDGTAKVLDFGLARAFDGSDGVGDQSQLPTITSPAMTAVGVVLGTAAYMSPEQACGKRVDKRADIWAFGCVLYEMLTGRAAFGGETVTEVLAKILEREPDFSKLPGRVSPQLAHLLRRCLEKDPRRRLRDIGEARVELEAPIVAREAQASAQPGAMRLRVWQRPLPLAAITLTLMAVAGLGLWAVVRPAPPRVTRTTITPSANAPLTIGSGRSLAIASDGTRLVYVGANATQLVVRELHQLQPRALTGLGLPTQPTLSPDGQWIAFFDGNTALKKVAVTGGPSIMLSSTNSGGAGASWSPDDTIIFATADPSTGLLRVTAAGGEPEILTKPDRAQAEVDHAWPQVLPGGQAVLFTALAAGNQMHVAILDLRTGEQRVLLRGGSHAQYVAPGYLVYAVTGTLHAVAFDLGGLEVTGSPLPVVDGVVTMPLGAVNANIAGDGTLVYVPGGAVTTPRRTLMWVDRQGREEVLATPPRTYRYPRLSPDGTKVAVEILEQVSDIWIWDLAGRTLTRFTFDPAQDLYPVWTPGGRRLAFRSGRAGPFNVFWQAADGTGAVERLTDTPNEQAPYAISPDGTRLILRQDDPKGGGDIMMLALDGDRQLTPLIQTPFKRAECGALIGRPMDRLRVG